MDVVLVIVATSAMLAAEKLDVFRMTGARVAVMSTLAATVETGVALSANGRTASGWP
jgi:hypothetical protein